MRSNPSKDANLIKKVLIVLVAVNFIFLIALNSLSSGEQKLQDIPSSERSLQESDLTPEDEGFTGTTTISSPEDLYRFTNPALAYQVLSQLDVFEPVNASYLTIGPDPKSQYHKPYLGLMNDPEYCNKHRARFVENPEIVFEQKNIIMESGPRTLIRGKVVRAIGTDIMPNIGRQMADDLQNEFNFEIHPDANLFHSVSGIQKYKHVGQHFACLSQEYNHIPGHYSLNRKDTIAEGANNYAKKFQDRPQCFSFDKYFPKTWLLYDKESCIDFFNELNSPEHDRLLAERQIVYIKKVAVGSHRGKGVTPLHAEEEAILKKEYKNGRLCGINKKLSIVQNYLHNPLLLNGRKFDFRMYMTIGSSNPLMAFYHDGFLRVSLYEYDVNEKDKKVLLTNLALNDDVYSDAKKGKLHHGMTEEDLKIAQQWSFERLQEYLLQVGKITDPNWLENYLRPEFKKAMIHLIRMSSHTFLRQSSLYEFYGVDFMLDDDLTLWFIEANSGPALDGYHQEMEKFIIKMLKDHFEIAFNMLKSRMKRVVGLVNMIIREGQVTMNENGETEVRNLGQWREEFKKVSKNYFEPEFELSPDNGYVKFLDDNLSRPERYSGLIDEACYDY